MSAAATFSTDKKGLGLAALGSLVVVFSIVIGGVLGYYSPILSKILTIIYTGLSFYLPKSTDKFNVFVTGALMFLIFTALPFNISDALVYLLYGVITAILFSLFFYVFERKKAKSKKNNNTFISHREQILRTIVVVSSLLIAWIISKSIGYLYPFGSLSHLYWIGLTILVVLQSTSQRVIKTALKRIIVNIIGAVLIVFVFNYLMPDNFWVNFALLVFLLFMIFFMGFSYVYRTLFIEMFVLGFTHLLGGYHTFIAEDRIILTLIGGVIVIMVVLLISVGIKLKHWLFI